MRARSPLCRVPEIPGGSGLKITSKFSSARGHYRSGDYWLIPARVLTGKIEWPESDGTALALPAKGIEHHYAPLAMIAAIAASPYVDIQEDCRCRFAPLPCLGPNDV